MKKLRRIIYTISVFYKKNNKLSMNKKKIVDYRNHNAIGELLSLKNKK